jgi:4-amino-4-deoxy-L-arabinose transferase-like glycosyltransferase
LVSLGSRIPALAPIPATASSNSLSPEPNIRKLFWLLAFLLGGLEVWARRFDVAPDGISYMEVARAGGSDFINAYWSPLYPFLLRLAFRSLSTSLYWESSVVHFVNLAVLLFSLACFEIVLKELLRVRQASPQFQNGHAPLSQGRLWMAGYVFFLWAVHFWVTPAWITPDLLVASFAFLATAMLLRIYRRGAGWLTFASLGLILGLAYLAKTPMFLLGCVFLACASRLSTSRKILHVSTALAFFLAIAAPFVFLLSSAKGRLTFGDSGKINYAEFVDGAPKYVHWQGEPPGTGVPLHPTREILSTPLLYEFSAPVRGSYPPWYDPSYWYEGITPHFSVKGELLALYRTASSYFRIISVTGVLYIVFVPLLVLAQRRELTFGKFGSDKRIFLVWVPAYAALVMYALVHVEARFVGGFLLMLVMNLLARVRLVDSPRLRWLAKLAGVVVLVPAIAVVSAAALNVTRGASKRSFEEWEVAQALHNMGISGVGVGYVGTGLDAYWAHLAQVRIVAEVPDLARPSFVQASPERKAEVIREFRDLGVAAVVTKFPDVASSDDHWQGISDTHYFIWPFEPNRRPATERMPN